MELLRRMRSQLPSLWRKHFPDAFHAGRCKKLESSTPPSWYRWTMLPRLSANWTAETSFFAGMWHEPLAAISKNRFFQQKRRNQLGYLKKIEQCIKERDHWKLLPPLKAGLLRSPAGQCFYQFEAYWHHQNLEALSPDSGHPEVFETLFSMPFAKTPTTIFIESHQTSEPVIFHKKQISRQLRFF